MTLENLTDNATTWLEAEFVARHEWAPGLATFKFAEIYLFSPGQFVNLEVEHAGVAMRRSYSIASAPGQPLELLITRVESGEFTPALFALRSGDKQRVSPRPFGFFTPEYVPACRELWLMATGTGLGPYISMLRSRALLPLCERIILVHGVRELAHLAYREELERLAAQPENRFFYVPAVSQGAAQPGVLSGRITSLLAEGTLEQTAGAVLNPHAHLLLCGNPAMIQDMAALLQARGLKKHRKREPGHYSFEKYW